MVELSDLASIEKVSEGKQSEFAGLQVEITVEIDQRRRGCKAKVRSKVHCNNAA